MATSPGGSPQIKPAITKQSQRRIRENEVIVSDRIPLVNAANQFVGYMVEKQVLPSVLSAVPGREVEMTSEETATYNAALAFLHRQFTDGFKETEPYEKRVESEDNTDFAHAPPQSA